MRTLLLPVFFVLGWLVGSDGVPVASGAEQVLSERTVALEEIEALFGVTPAVGAVGDGRLTAQVSREGTITCLRWPNATFYEHVHYVTAGFAADNNGAEAAGSGWRIPHFGETANAGVFAALVYAQAGSTVVRWLREAPSKDFAYAAPDSNRLLGTYTWPDGAAVVEATFVVHERPLLMRSYTLKALPQGAGEPRIVVVANPALRTDYGSAYIPLPQTSEDNDIRFASFWDENRRAIVTAQPRNASDFRRRQVAARIVAGDDAAAVAAFVGGRLDDWGQGTYLAQGASVPPQGYQVGRDDELTTFGPQDAYRDSTDGTLSGAPLAVSFTTTALAFPVTADVAVAWYAAFGTTYTEAIAMLAATRARGPEHWSDESDRWWANWLSGAVLPTQSERARQIAQRALISLRTGYDPDSGAIVASTSCQPPYNLDWPRDGAFFQAVLELNGKVVEADRHARFYIGKNQERRLYGPHGSWAMNYYADGTPGGPIDFEIDEVGFGLYVFGLRAYYAAQTDPAAARVFLLAARESLRAAADLLVDCKDEAGTGLQCRAHEDDNEEQTISLHGAVTVWLGLVWAAAAEQALGDDLDRAARYQARADELAAAIRRFYTPDSGEDQSGILSAALGWSIWPAQFWHADETPALAGAARMLTERLQRTLLGEQAGTSYDQKHTLALAAPPLRSRETLATVEAAHQVYMTDVVTPQGHLGEGTVHDDFDGDGDREWRNITALPHIWAQVLTYLSLLMQEAPAALLQPIPAKLAAMDLSGAAVGVRTRDGGGGCSAGGVGALAAWPVLLAAWALRRRSRR